MPSKPKILVSINGAQANLDLSTYGSLNPDFTYAFGIKRIIDSDVFLTHFLLNFNFVTTSQNPKDMLPKDTITI